MQHKYLTFLAAILCCLPFYLTSQSLSSKISLRGGLSIGAPIIVTNIPEEASGKPGFGPNLGIQWQERFYSNFSLSIGMGYSEKGASFISPVSGKYDAARGIWGESFPIPLRIGYTGVVDATIENKYLDFPIIVNYHLNNWRVGVGYQYSKLLNGSLKGSVDVKALLLNFRDQPFDESAMIQSRENVGIFTVGRQLTDRLSLALDTTVSFDRLLTQVEEGVSNPRNVYVHLMVGFQLFKIQRSRKFTKL